MLSRKSFALSALAALICCVSGSAASADQAAWAKYMLAGSNAFEQANYGQAERMFRLAFGEAQKFGDHDIRLAQTLTNIGILFRAHGQVAKAGPVLERALVVEENALGPNNYEVVSSSAKMCQFYLQQGNPTKADQMSAKVINYAQRSWKDRRQVASSFKTLNNYYQTHRDLEDAEIMVKQAEELTHKHSANHDLELAVLLDALATAYGNKPQAEPMYKLALDIREQSLPPKHMALAQSCENLAKLYMDEGKVAEAEPLFRRALEISEKTLGNQRGETLNRVDGLAQCCVRLGKEHEAEQLYKHALELVDGSHGKSSGGAGKLQLALGNMLARQGRYPEAAPYLSQALKMQESMQGPQHASLSPILDAYADVLDKTNRHAEANKLHSRAKQIRGWM